MRQFTRPQQRAIFRRQNLVVTAGAGAGKTRVLVERYLRILRSPAVAIDQVVAITFTEKAAAEMKSRVRETLHTRAGRPGRSGRRARYLLERLERARISTFHSFCQSLLRAYPVEALVDPDFSVAADLDASTLLVSTVDTVLTRAAQTAAGPAVDLLSRYSREKLATLLAETVLQMRNHGLTPAAVRALTRATLAAQADPAPLAAGLQAAVDALLAQPTKAGSKGYELQQHLRAAWDRLAPRLPELAGPDAALLVAELEAMAEPLDARSLKASKLLDEAIARCASRLNNREAAELAESFLSMLDTVLAEYAARKEAANLLDFADLIARALQLLREHPAVRAELAAQGLRFLVDEFQDTDPQQWDVIRLVLTDPAGDGALPPDRLFIVGDPKQSIYRFRGAKVRMFGQAGARVAEEGGSGVFLDANFRAQEGLIRLVNALFGQILGQGGGVPYAEMTHARTLLPHTAELLVAATGEEDGAAELRKAEAGLIAARIRELVHGGGRSFGDVAILLQAMTHVNLYAEALARAGVPYYIVAGDGFYEAQEILDTANLLRVLNTPRDAIALLGWLRSPHIGLSDDAVTAMGLHPQGFPGAWDDGAFRPDGEDGARLDRARRLLPRLQRIAWQEPLPGVLPALYAELEIIPVLLAQPDGERQAANLQKLARMAAGFAQLGRHQFTDLLGWLQVAMEQEAREGLAPTGEEGQNTVLLMTIHKAKGLEFPVVILPDMGRSPRQDGGEILLHPDVGLAPKLLADDGKERPSGLRLEARERNQEENLAEFRRLFYVAATRARDYLIFSAREVKAKKKDGETPSTWLHWLIEACGADPGALPAELSCGGIAIPVRAGVGAEAALEAAAGAAVDAEEAALPSVAEVLAQIAPLPVRPARGGIPASPSRLMVLQDCARKFYLQFVLRMPDLEPAPTGWESLGEPESPAEDARTLEATVRGTIVHAVCEHLRDGADLELLIRQACAEHGVDSDSPEVEAQIRAPLRRFVASPFFARLRTATESYPELPFRLEAGGLELEGVMDQVAVVDGQLEVVDYKTNNVWTPAAIEKAAGHYRLQMQIYALAAARELGRPVSDAVLYFLAPGQAYSFAGHMDADESLAVIEGLGRVLRESHGWEEFAPNRAHCAECRYQRLCAVEE